MNNSPKTETNPLHMHYIELFDSVANIAKASGQYSTMVNALFTVTAIVLSELKEDAQAQETLKLLNERQQQYREQNIASKMAEVPQTTGVQ